MYPEIVYKYRGWISDFDKNVILKNELYLASPKDFNDPFDCRIPTNYSLLNSNERIELFVNKKIENQFAYLTSHGYDIEKQRKNLEFRLKNNIADFQNDQDNYQYQLQDKHYGVLSLSARWNSILMWSHYGDKHRGYCIGFDEEKLRSSGLFGAGGPVRGTMNDDFPIIDPLGDDSVVKQAFDETHTKANEWSYEQEYRLTKVFGKEENGVVSLYEPTTAERIRPVTNDFFKEIIVGLNATYECKRELIDIAKTKGIKIFQATKLPFKFRIERVEL